MRLLLFCTIFSLFFSSCNHNCDNEQTSSQNKRIKKLSREEIENLSFDSAYLINDSTRLLFDLPTDSSFSSKQAIAVGVLKGNELEVLFQTEVLNHSVLHTNSSPKRTIIWSGGGGDNYVINHEDLSYSKVEFKEYSGGDYIEKIEFSEYPVALVTIYIDSLPENFQVSIDNDSNNFPWEQNEDSDEFEIQLYDLLPPGYTLRNYYSVDFTEDLKPEILVHCTSDKKIECMLLGDTNCFGDELWLFKSANELELIKSYSLPHPLNTDSNFVSLEIDSLNNLIVIASFMPTGTSTVHQKKYYSYQEGEFLLDSLYHSVGTKMYTEFSSWKYKVDLKNNIIKFNSGKLDISIEESYERGEVSLDTIIKLDVKKKFKVSDKISIGDFIPSGIEEPYY